MSDEEICTCCDEENEPKSRRSDMGVANALGLAYLALFAAVLIVALAL